MKIFWRVLMFVAAAAFSACDPCSKVDCQNGGSCVDGTCQCVTGYEGTECETKSRTRFVGSFTVSETCLGAPGVTFNNPIIIDTSATAVNLIIIRNLYNTGWSVEATVKGAAVSFKDAVVSGTPAGVSLTATGSGTMAGTALTLKYGVRYGTGASDSCQVAAVKK
ncbi:MAG: calcium-binding EGF-like domain-containing protein [Bacteroidia bacterium]|nr:calcium-binding EGF-like domain-containing protein [Bacteroidia bacterium]